MEEKELQIENGNFTRIINPLIDNLLKIPFKGCELAVALFIIRKTYGYQKKQDEISLTQFMSGLDKSRVTIVKALKNLQLVNIAILVKKGDSRNKANLWQINKYFSTWKLVKTAKLVKTKRKQLVKTAIHTKEIVTKERYIYSLKEIFEKEIIIPNNEHTGLIDEEKVKFLAYWTEKSPNGKKERWQMERVFDVKRRFWGTWIGNVEKRMKPKVWVKPVDNAPRVSGMTPLGESLKNRFNK